MFNKSFLPLYPLHVGRRNFCRPLHLGITALALSIAAAGLACSNHTGEQSYRDSFASCSPVLTLAFNPGAGDSAGEYAPETAVPVAPSGEADCAVSPPPAWEIWAQDNGCSDEAFELIRTAAAEYERDDVDMACLLACIAYPESTFRIGVKGAAGERGLVQIHPIHRQRMCKLGLDFDSELDRLRFACILLTTAFEFGGDLSDALQPWSPRKRIQRQYEALTGESNE